MFSAAVPGGVRHKGLKGVVFGFELFGFFSGGVRFFVWLLLSCFVSSKDDGDIDSSSVFCALRRVSKDKKRFRKGETEA